MEIDLPGGGAAEACRRRLARRHGGGDARVWERRRRPEVEAGLRSRVGSRLV
jgi:hypothetical protein